MYVLTMIERLQYERLVSLLPELYSAQTLETFPKHIIALLPRLIPGEIYGYNETNLARRRFEVLADPTFDARVGPLGTENLSRLLRHHPMILHNRTSDQSALKMSDL